MRVSPDRAGRPLRWPDPPPNVPWPWSRRSAQRLYVSWVLSSRPPTEPQRWGPTEAQRLAARRLGEAVAEAFRWPNAHFVPADEWRLVTLGRYTEAKSVLEKVFDAFAARLRARRVGAVRRFVVLRDRDPTRRSCLGCRRG
jgi:hypothetical protein